MHTRITARLKQQGLTTRELAVRLGMRCDMLQYKLDGTVTFTLDEAVRLREVLGLPDSIESLFFDAAGWRK